MANIYFDQAAAKTQLVSFFANEKANITNFGDAVNQTFEAQVLANVFKWYKQNGWALKIINPIKNNRPTFTLKFNTRGAPVNYSYAICTKGTDVCQIRHGLRTHTKYYSTNNSMSANIVCDIVVMKDLNIDHFTTNSALPNADLISFGEVKHMSAFAELIASFIGLAHELKPDTLKPIRKKKWKRPDKISCFLYVSGILNPTAKGLIETINKRKYDIDIYSFENPM
jgi:hypothetical protein